MISGYGFGTRILIEKLLNRQPVDSIILADLVDSRPMTREQGLVRLIVPSGRVDALQQVKRINRIILGRQS